MKVRPQCWQVAVVGSGWTRRLRFSAWRAQAGVQYFWRGLGEEKGAPQWAQGRPVPGSPCIDAGDNDAVPGWVTTDLEGSPRFVDDPLAEDTGNPGTSGPPIVDMGAYELQVLVGDFNGDGSVDLDDYGLIAGCFTGPRPLSPADYDANGVADLEDFAWWEPCLAGPGEAPLDGCDMMDLHQDNDVDLADYAAFQGMFDFAVEPLPLECEPTDLDDDLDVDFGDFATLQASFTG